MRLDLPVIDAGADLVRDLAVLTGHREDLIADRVRMISRLRHLLTSVFPSLERAFDYSAFQTGAGFVGGGQPASPHDCESGSDPHTARAPLASDRQFGCVRAL